MDIYTHDINTLEKELGTDFDKGLSKRQIRTGKNKLTAKKRDGFFKLFFSGMSDFMTIVLLIAAAVSFISTHLNGENDIFEPILIVSIVILNTLLGTFQEIKAEKAISALRKLADSKVDVLREGKWQKILSENLCQGDIVKLKSGDKIPCDLRIIESVSLEADESALTGESESVYKENCIVGESSPLAERKNMLHQGTTIISGHAKCVAVSVGMDTEMGKIAKFITSNEKEETPLQKKLSALGKTLGILAILICALIFLIGIFKKIPPLDMFITAVSLAVAAIPEGLPATITVMLSLGVQRMAKKNAIIKKLSAVETLGAADIILSDKTGTLTENKMTVSEIYTEDEEFFKTAASVSSKESTNPTEQAILSFAGNSDGYNITNELPFNSKRKMMSCLAQKNGESFVFTKGAAEIVLSKCVSIKTKSGEKPITDVRKRQLFSVATAFAEKGLRVLGIAYKKSSVLTEGSLVFIGFIALSDPPRKEAKGAVSECESAGIKVVMVTGDHKKTAERIAEKIGILKPDSVVLSGTEIEKMTDEKLLKKLPRVAVFARVTPEQKLRIVKLYKSLDMTVAMTGDGVNDAPALKAADIGCSMGKNGTDVAKEASDMVLADDNFKTIVHSVREGRRIFTNIKKAVWFLLSSNIGELLCVFFGLVFSFTQPLSAPQLLWINLVTDSLPAIALGLEDEEKDIMKKPPNKHKSLLSKSEWISIGLEGAMIGALSLIAGTVGNIFFCGVGKTMAFFVLAISQLIHAFNVRCEKSSIKSGLFKNKVLNFSFVLGVFLTYLLAKIPSLSLLFGVSPLTTVGWI
ncbi:MAG: cation-translocating P-type ATPase, partial [Clostridia bacterium]|nr:cation-translocating P-type ATPase [Clostridia bacterium]